MAVLTLEDVDTASKYHYEPPFLIVSHVVEDIGLVGWANKRWTHQDKKKWRNPATPAHASGWMQAFDPDRKQYYFYNHSLNVSTWEAPQKDFTPDETVEYYLKAGVAQPWQNSGSPAVKGTHSRRRQFSPSFKTAQVLHSDVGAQHADAELLLNTDLEETGGDHQAATAGTLVPAHVTFSPTKKGELQPNVERYWILRYSLFSRWTSGVCLNETSLFSVTPEVIAEHHACMLQGGKSVLDAFSGCGGNTIALAKHFNQVVACDIDNEQLEFARRNCKVYGVEERVTFVHGDVFSTSVGKVDAVFLSPPWGGPGDNSHAFDATSSLPELSWSVKDSIMMACNCLSDESLSSREIAKPNIAVYLPRFTLLSSLAECLVVPGFELEPLCLERNVLNGHVKAATLYLRCKMVP